MEIKTWATFLKPREKSWESCCNEILQKTANSEITPEMLEKVYVKELTGDNFTFVTRS